MCSYVESVLNAAHFLGDVAVFLFFVDGSCFVLGCLQSMGGCLIPNWCSLSLYFTKHLGFLFGRLML